MKPTHVSPLELMEGIRNTSTIKVEMEFEAVKDQLIVTSMPVSFFGLKEYFDTLANELRFQKWILVPGGSGGLWIQQFYKRRPRNDGKRN